MGLKVLGKSFIYKAVKSSKEELRSEIERAGCVSFDVFDTLVKRDVAEPKDVFTYLEGLIEKDEAICFRDFVGQRISAERKARESAPDREVTLSEIYGYFPSDEAQRKCLMKMECAAEIDLSTVNPAIKPLYELCLELGKKVFFISDMYLPSAAVEDILRKNGYTEGRLFVSSDSGLTKHSGKLFEYVRKNEGLAYEDWVHIGDSISGDYLAPKRLGITACLIERDPQENKYFDKKLFKRSADYRQLNHFIDTRIGRYTDPYERIGYAVLGPLLYGFACWLEREVPQDETIVFLAREGELLQKAFEIISDRPSVYMHISRHAAGMAHIDHSSSPEAVLKTGVYPVKALSAQREWAKGYGLSDSQVHRVFSENHLEEDCILRTADAGEMITAIWPVAKENARGQYAMLKQYFEQLHLSNNCAVIDVGWRGSIQALLNACEFANNGALYHWDGYYMGCFQDGPASAYCDIEMKGFLFNNRDDPRLHDGVRNSASFFEFLFLSTEGTTKAYKRDETGTVCPVLGEPENNDCASAIITSIQEAGIQFVQDLHRSVLRGLLTVDAAISAYNYQSLARVPSLSTLSLFSQFNSYDEYVFGLVSEHGLGHYLLHPKQFVHDFTRKPGKTWFLKSVFKIPLPYISMINLARKMFLRA